MFVVYYKDDDGELAIGPFHERAQAVDWMFEFADTQCDGCEVKRNHDFAFEFVEVKHNFGNVCTLTIERLMTPQEFINEWEV